MLIDNHTNNLVTFLNEKIEKEAELSFVSAYFTINAFWHLKEKLQQANSVRFIFGEPKFISQIDPSKQQTKNFTLTEDGLNFNDTLKQKVIAKECREWFSKESVHVKSISDENRLIHGKMYLVKNTNQAKSAVLGSSNFTSMGLGIAGNANLEININVEDSRDYDEMKNWFDEKWGNNTLLKDVKTEVLEYLDNLYVDNSPEFVFFKTLYKLFEHRIADLSNPASNIDAVEDKDFINSKIWNKLFSFQQDGVTSIIRKIKKWRGCILADSVGLGKTFEALAVIKYFQLKGEKILVLSPKKLINNWSAYNNNSKNSIFYNHETQELEERFNFDLFSHSDLRDHGRSANGTNLKDVVWGDYGLVVVDESHNFRNQSKGKNGKITGYEKLLEDIIKAGAKTKVLLLSATPINNSFSDLESQVQFITAGQDGHFYKPESGLEITNVKSLFKKSKTQYTTWVKSSTKTTSQLLDKLDPSLFNLLDEISIARSRKQIEKFYKSDIEKIGSFPTRLAPLSIKLDKLDLEGGYYSFEELNNKINEFRLSLYCPSEYVKKDADLYQKYDIKYHKDGLFEDGATPIASFDQAARERYLIGMMKMNFLKRLESSVDSFSLTLERSVNKINNTLEKIKKQKNSEAQSFENDETEDIAEFQEQEEELENIQVGGKIKYDLVDLDLDKWEKDLKNDKIVLQEILIQTQKISADKDAKLNELLAIISNKHNQQLQLQNSNKKILIFTAYADTAKYIYKYLKAQLKGQNLALVTGSGVETTIGINNYEEVLQNFSPVSKNRGRLDESQIDILVATDCISEGQNLQDCDCVINYDIHWNPVRLIQRFGRIDRIGSINKNILMVNFWPTKDLNKYLNLEERVKARMFLVNMSATGDDNILGDQENELKNEYNFREKQVEKQLEKMQTGFIDLDDDTESLDLNDFSLEEYWTLLYNFLKDKKLSQDPWGIYALVSEPASTDLILNRTTPPGVIFCLKSKDKINQKSKFGAYYLVYINQNQQIVYNYNLSKDILDIYYNLCMGKALPDLQLCKRFNFETKDGKFMDTYSELVKSAIAGIVPVQLQDDLLAMTMGKIATPEIKPENFELITWLIVKPAVA